MDGDSSESEGKRPKRTPLPHMRLWSVIHTDQFRSTQQSLANVRYRWYTLTS